MKRYLALIVLVYGFFQLSMATGGESSSRSQGSSATTYVHLSDGNSSDEVKSGSEDTLCSSTMDNVGKSAKNQDRVLDSQFEINGNQFMITGVFDGHGIHGHEVSQTLAENFVKQLVQVIREKEQNLGKKLPRFKKGESVDHQWLIFLGNSINHAFFELDRQFCKNLDYRRSGSTASLALRFLNYVYTINLGDSRTVLIYNREFWVTTEDHVPSDETEKRRIENYGGGVITTIAGGPKPRLNGALAVSRAFGDCQFKVISYDNLYTLKAPYENHGILSARPTMKIYELDDDEEFYTIFSGTDGLFDAVDSQDQDFIKHVLHETKKQNRNLCDKMVNFARNRGSKDDITVIVSSFNPSRI